MHHETEHRRIRQRRPSEEPRGSNHQLTQWVDQIGSGRHHPRSRVAGKATDPAPDAEANLRHYIDAAWKDLTTIGLSATASRDYLKFTTDLKKALADADFVQENGPERKDFKVKLFADLDAATRPDSIIASSSSGLTMSTMQSACKHPGRQSRLASWSPHTRNRAEPLGGYTSSSG
jgi:hypothetical protein